jgi:hypothetical protein
VWFSVAADVTGRTRALAIYRARSAAGAVDIRRMRPVTEVVLSQPADQPTVILDTGLFEETDYFYRLVAIGEEGVRSRPTNAMRATTIALKPPPAVVVQAIVRDAAQPTRRTVELLIPRRDYPIYLFRRRQFGATWESPTATGIGADGRVDLAILATAPVPAGYRVMIDDLVPVADVPWSYVARIEDRRGRMTMGLPAAETP